MIGLFIKVISFQLSRKYRRATAFNFDKCNVMGRFERIFTQSTWNNTNSTKIYDFERVFVKEIIFKHLRKYRRATAVNFHKYGVF